MFEIRGYMAEKNMEESKTKNLGVQLPAWFVEAFRQSCKDVVLQQTRVVRNLAQIWMDLPLKAKQCLYHDPDEATKKIAEALAPDATTPQEPQQAVADVLRRTKAGAAARRKKGRRSGGAA